MNISKEHCFVMCHGKGGEGPPAQSWPLRREMLGSVYVSWLLEGRHFGLLEENCFPLDNW